ncbi:MAG: ABC transporter permease, partial [Gammaproteobacteria bacterium]|nr:ABC transporter permease [Gammaproteobacteria bacterium]
MTAELSALSSKRRFRPNSSLLLGGAIVLFMVLAAVFAPLLTPYDPIRLNIASRFQPPSAEHWFGTDQYGRDVLTRVLHGARYDLLIAVLAVALAAGIGTPLGLIAGYFRGWTDTVIMRLMDLLLAFPNILLAMTLAAVLGPSLDNAILAVAIVGIAGYARIAYASTLSAKADVYVEAARALGASHHRLMLRAILPAIIAPIVIRGTLGMGFTILLAAGLGFIGLGAQPPTPEWGAMINEGRNQVILGRWWTSVFPGLAIVLLVTGFNLLG